MLRKTLLLAVLAVALTASEARAEAAQDFSIVNRTGYQIDSIYIGAVDSSEWGDDVMGKEAVADGESVDITFKGNSNACKWDIRVVYNDGDETEWHGVNLCDINTVTLFWNRKAGTTRAVAE